MRDGRNRMNFHLDSITAKSHTNFNSMKFLKMKIKIKNISVSSEIRERAPHVIFRVGDVVKHKVN